MSTPQPTTSFNFQQSLQVLLNNSRNVYTQRSVAAFDAVQANANWTEALFTIGAGAAVAAVISAVFHPFSFVSVLFSTFIGEFIGAFIGVGILWAIAVYAFKGTGQFLPYMYTLSLIMAPVVAVDAILGIIPVLGTFAALLIALFAGYMAVLATQSVHKLSQGKAILTVVIPAVIVFVIGAIVSIVFAAFYVALLHSAH